MQSTVRSTIDNPRISVTLYMRCLLERLAKAARMDDFLADTQRRSTFTGEQVTGLASAFAVENLGGFTDEEIMQIFCWYTRLRYDMTDMAKQLITYFRNPVRHKETSSHAN